MKLKLITCEVLTRLVCHCVARTPHIVEMDYAKKGAHDDSDYLRELLQKKIDDCEESEEEYDAILLGYGLCGNSVVNLVARSLPLVIPRAHDCCTLFLGSKEKYAEHFGDSPSKAFSAAGYMEHEGSYVEEASGVKERMGLDKKYDEYVEQYGEENARYIWETLHPKREPQEEDNKHIFIEIPELRHLGYAEQCRCKAQADGEEFVELEGSIELIEKLIFGEWSAEDFLVVEPEQRIMGVYDMDEVVRAN
ncbi:DUF1638 domain-containing protein [Candidatus Poribacteria bacterium]